MILEEIIGKNFLNLMKSVNLHIQETQCHPSKRNMKKTTLKHIIIILLKSSGKEENLKSNQRRKAHYTQRNKAINNSTLLLRNYARQKIMEQNLFLKNVDLEKIFQKLR